MQGGSPERPPSEPEGEELPAVAAEDQGDITDEEFEQLLDALEGAGGPDDSEADDSGSNNSGDSGDISDDEFEALLDQLHGKGKFSGEVASAASPDPDNNDQESPPGDPAAAANGGSELITDDEFERLLDELHGKGNSPAPSSGTAADNQVEDRPADKAPEPAPKPAVEPARPAARASSAQGSPAAAETSVRVDTRRLDDIMNMVGELVLVRNRLQRLGSESGDSEL